MRITEIAVDRYRIWRDLRLPLHSDGLSVFYGPNEAGKTTLMRFVRAALYGFSAEDCAPRGPSGQTAPWRGSVVCRHAGQQYVIERQARPGSRGRLVVRGGDDLGDANQNLAALLSGTTEDIFEDIFAIGVKELQQLATMDRDEVAERIYGLSLGPEGRSLLQAMSESRESRLALLNDGDQGGQLPRLFGRYEDLLANGRAFDPARENHAGLCRERDELQTELDKLRRRQNLIESNLTGYRHLRECWRPWNRLRSIRSELNGLPTVPEIPENLLEQIHAVDGEIRSAERKWEAARAASEQARRELDRHKAGGELTRQAAAVQALVNQTQWLTELEDRINKSKSAAERARQELQQAIVELGPDWTLERVEAVDASPSAHARLLEAARKYQTALGRRGRLRRINRGLSRSTQSELVELNEQLEALGGQSIEEAIASERLRLTQLEDVGRLKIEASELRQRSGTIRKLVGRIDSTATVPEWIDNIFTVFGVVGVIFFFFGLLFWAFGGWGIGSLHGALAGAAFGSAGLTWFFCRLGLKNHFDNQAGLRLDDLHEEARTTEARLTGVQSQLTGLLRESGRSVEGGTDAGPTHEVDLMRESVHRIAELEDLARREQRLAARRERLSGLRGRFRAAQQQVAQVRTEWAGLLRSLGLEETVRVKAAFELWGRLQEVNAVRVRYRDAAPEIEAQTRLYEELRSRIEEIGCRCGLLNLDYKRPLTVLSGWREELKNLERDREVRQKAIEEQQLRQRESAEAEQALERLKVKRSGLLAQVGAASVEELRQQQEWLELRSDCEIQLSEAQADLEQVVAANPHIALVEEDLLAYDEQQTREAIELAELEFEDISEQLGSARERMGSIRNEIEVLEQNRSTRSARFERGQVAGRIHRCAEEWFAMLLAEDVLDQMRVHLESSGASATLAIASDYLNQLTEGRYLRVWAPLGRNRLRVDDRLGRTFRVEQLSGGTREQLFLAIRLALVREFSEKGLELPMVMDDLFVNFDEGRTAAAVDALIRFADSGQQVLFFTCHRHLAGLFEQRGVRPVWLPGPVASELRDEVDDQLIGYDDVEEPIRRAAG